MKRELENEAREKLSRLFMGPPNLLRSAALSGHSFEDFTEIYHSIDGEPFSEEPEIGGAFHPRIFLENSATALELTYGLWLAALVLYSSPREDRANLSDWLNRGMPFSAVLMNKSSLVKLGRNNGARALRRENIIFGYLMESTHVSDSPTQES